MHINVLIIWMDHQIQIYLFLITLKFELGNMVSIVEQYAGVPFRLFRIWRRFCCNAKMQDGLGVPELSRRTAAFGQPQAIHRRGHGDLGLRLIL